MSPVVKSSSVRARRMIAMCNNSIDQNYASESPVPTSPACSSFSWWDGVLEAADLTKKELFPRNLFRPVETAKRKLFSSENGEPVPFDEGYTHNNSKREFNSRRDNTVEKDFHQDSGSRECVHCPYSISPEIASPNFDVATPPPALFSIAPTQLASINNENNYHESSQPVPLKGKEAFEDIANLPMSVRNFERDPKGVKNSTQLYPSQQKIFHAKQALNSGVEHVSSQGKFRSARYLKPACQEKCKKCSSPRLTEDERKAVHESFWKLKDHEAQWLHIAGLIKCSAPKKKFAATGSKCEKHSIRTYHLIVNEKFSKVCKTMFKNTLSICDSWIDSALSHVCETTVKPDLRGKHANRPKRLNLNS